MLGRKFYTLLEKLSKKEQNDFKKYFDCTYFTSKTERKLMAAILAYHPHYLQAEIDSKILYAQVFPAADFNYKKLKDLFADLAHQVELFTAINHIKKDRFQQKKLLAIAYHQKADFLNFSKASNAALKALNKQSELYATYERLTIMNYQHYFLHEEKDSFSNSTLRDNNDLLNESFVLNKLRFYSESLAGKNVYLNQNIDTLPFYEIVMKLAKRMRLTNELINLYFQSIILFKKNDKAQFLKVNTAFLFLQPSLTPSESAIIFAILINFTIARFQERDDSYLAYQFDLYKLGIAQQFFTTSNVFSTSAFLNIVATGLVLKKANFIKDFIKQTISLLPINKRGESEQLAWAYYHFYKKDYDKVGKIVAVLESASVIIALRAHFLGLRTHFEYYLEDLKFLATQTAPFLSTCAKFERYIKSLKELAPIKKEAYLNHLVLLKELAFCMQNKGNQRTMLQQILQKIRVTNVLIGWQYLGDKTNELLKQGIGISK